MKTFRNAAVLSLSLAIVPGAATAEDAKGNPTESSAVDVDEAPPDAPQAETPPPAPAATHVWIPGHWRWNGHRHAWESGHWEQPPQAGVAWIPASWIHVGHRWRLVPGHWAAAAPAVEVRPAVPAVGAVRVLAGYHRRGMHWVYSPGHWESAIR
jgi:hypothetical protein